jgi:hypothetical protein
VCRSSTPSAIGLKLRARRRSPPAGQADIQALFDGDSLARRRPLRDYFRLFEHEDDLERLLAGAPSGVGACEGAIYQALACDLRRGRAPIRDLDEFIEFLRRLQVLFG